MKVALIGSRWFGAQVLQLLRNRGDDVTVVAPDADDWLAQAAKAAGIPCVLLNGRRRVSGDDVPDGVDVVLAAHSHATSSRPKRGPRPSAPRSDTIRRCCRGTGASRPSNGPSAAATRSRAAACIT